MKWSRKLNNLCTLIETIMTKWQLYIDHIPVLAKKMIKDWILPQKLKGSNQLSYLDATFGHGSMARILLGEYL